MAKNIQKITCRQCWKFGFCLPGQNENIPCRFFEPKKMGFMDEEEGETGQKHGGKGTIRKGR